MTIVFERPVGAHRDVKELEYLSALHQTANEVRKDASVTSEDVTTYLISRHGIQADKEVVEQRVMPGLAGATSEHASPVFDMPELVSLLLIPHLKKLATSNDEADIEELFGCTFNTLMSDVYGSAFKDPPVLNRDTLTRILESYGEVDVPPQVIDEMLEAAGATKDSEEVVLDVAALVRATTSDLDRYDNNWSESYSTHIQDVFEGTTPDAAGVLDNKGKDTLDQMEKEVAQEPDQVSFYRSVTTLASIDYAAETFTNKTFVPLLWLLTVVLYFLYFFHLGTTLSGTVDCDHFRNDFGCKVVNAITAWLVIFVELSIIVGIFVILASSGSSLYTQAGYKSVLFSIIGIGGVALGTFCVYAIEDDFFFFKTFKDNFIVHEAGYVFTLLLGVTLLLFHVKSLIFNLVPRQMLEKLPGSGYLLVPGTVRAERDTKKAADYKVAEMIGSALRMHTGMASSQRGSTGSQRSSGFGSALLNYQATVDERESCGGIVWTYKKIWNGTIFHEEGVWFHARLLACNVSQYVLAIGYVLLVIFVELWVTDFLAEDETTDDGVTDDFSDDFTFSPTISPAPSLNPFDQSILDAVAFSSEVLDFLSTQSEAFINAFWQQVDPEIGTNISSGIINSAPYDVIVNIVNSTNPDALGNFVDAAQALFNVTAANATSADTGEIRRRLEDTEDLFQPWEVFFGVGLGGATAIVAILGIAIIWLPSAVSTILKFRSGVIGSLRDSEFQQYRVAPDLTTILLGSTFWGVAYASVMLFGIVGVVCFLLVWEELRSTVLLLLAQIVGISVTIATKMLILIPLRKLFYSGFFRKQPASANVMLVLFECWSLGLTVGTMFVRLIKLVLVSAFYVGRLDTPMLAPGVGNVAGAPLDAYPVQFRKDLLIHDAHRHPYMERLGVMYLLKLRYGDEFGLRGCSAWRLIVVMSLMPWLRRYRLDEAEKEEDVELAIEGGETRVHVHDVDNVGDMRDEIRRLRERIQELEKEKELHA